MKQGQMPEVGMPALRAMLEGQALEIAILCLRKPDAQGVVRLRASKPDYRRRMGKGDEVNYRIAAYAWRMAAFSVSPKSQHHCMPTTATFYLPGRYASETYKHAQAIGDRVEAALVAAVNPADWHGVRRWGQALGLVGSPRYDANGSVIYR